MKKQPLYCNGCDNAHTNYANEGYVHGGLEVWTCLKHTGYPMRIGGKDGLPVRARETTVPEALRAAADTYEQRNKLWGDNYKQVGAIMVAMLPAGVKLETADDWNRFLLFGHIINKVTRYAQNLNTGGNKDSAHDLTVYAAMLEEMTQEQK